MFSPDPLSAAQNRALDVEFLRDQFGRLGNTPYELSELELELTGAPFAPASLLNQLRREAVEKLQAAQAIPRSLGTAGGLAAGSFSPAKHTSPDSARSSSPSSARPHPRATRSRH